MEDAASLRAAIAELCGIDPAFGGIEAAAGPLAFRRRPPGFATLVRILVGQQLSTAAATTIYARLEAASGGVAPEFFLTNDDAALRALGLSAQKSRYIRALAAAISTAALDLDGLAALPDESCLAELTAISGIGVWTARIYLLAALARPDVWPDGDVGLQAAYQSLAGLPQRPSAAELAAIAERWRPWRSVAARLLWHYHDRTRMPV
jgi:DNA-3-methyladenine glycosylase II